MKHFVRWICPSVQRLEIILFTQIAKHLSLACHRTKSQNMLQVSRNSYLSHSQFTNVDACVSYRQTQKPPSKTALKLNMKSDAHFRMLFWFTWTFFNLKRIAMSVYAKSILTLTEFKFFKLFSIHVSRQKSALKYIEWSKIIRTLYFRLFVKTNDFAPRAMLWI